MATYDRDLREFYELANRKAQLEARLSPEEFEPDGEADFLASSTGYRALLDVELHDLDSDRTAIVFRNPRPCRV